MISPKDLSCLILMIEKSSVRVIGKWEQRALDRVWPDFVISLYQGRRQVKGWEKEDEQV
jgi:hypothetical protein